MADHTSNSDSVQALDLSDLLGDDAPVQFPKSNQARALSFARQGIPVFPCAADKRPLIEGGFKAASTNEAQIKTWWEESPNALIGFPTGPASGIAVLDLDVKNGKDGVAACAARGVDPNTASPHTVTTPSGGRHLYFKDTIDLRCTAGKDGIDVRATGGYVIAYGPICDVASLPDWPAAFAPAPSRPAKDPFCLDDLLADTPNWDEVQQALTFIPANCSRDTWRNVGMALNAASSGGDDGFDIWREWSHTCQDSDRIATDREFESQWRSFKAGGITLGTLFHLATAHGYEKPSLEISATDFDDLPDDLPATIGRLTFLTPAECATSPARSYLIKGLIAERDVACIFGAPGAGKSLLAPYLGYAVAQGREAFGMRTKEASVFYVAAEDEHGMRGRVKALQMAHGAAENFKLVGGVSNLLVSGSPDLLELRQAVKAHRPKLIVIDTLAMAFPGLEENSADAMGRVVAVARKLTEYGAAVILIHHDTKSEGGTPRGHSLLNGALDAALHVKRDEQGIIRGKLTKNRNGSCDRDIAFRIAIETGGFDEDGDEITLPRCNEVNAASTKPTKQLSPQAKEVLIILQDLAASVLTGQVSKSDWRDACISSDKVSASEDRDTRSKAFKRAVESLTRDGFVSSVNGLCWVEDGFDDLPGFTTAEEMML